jgi:hypothetical protein
MIVALAVASSQAASARPREPCELGPRGGGMPSRRAVAGLEAVRGASLAVQAGALVERSDWVALGDPAHAALELQNRGLGAIDFEPVALNGRRVLHSFGDIDAEIAELPPQPPDDSLALRIFRFIAENRRHWLPLTLNLDWLLTPTLFFNSTGINACGEAAALVHILATAHGLAARRMGLGRHVVAEVYEDGRWKMLDADYGVYFLNREGSVASLAELEVDLALITSPLLWMPVPDPSLNPYTASYADLFAPPNGPVGQPVPVTPPPRSVRFSLPRGASLRLPGRFAVAPPDMAGEPLHDYRDLLLRLPAGATGVIGNPLIVHTVRGAGSVEIAGTTFEIGSPELAAEIDARESALETFRIVESSAPIEIVYLLNPLRWELFPTNVLTARVTEGAVLEVRGVATGDAAADSDGDGIGDDGGGSGIVGDQPCAGDAVGCDDNCVLYPNPLQLDADADARGNACDGDFDGNDLLTLADSRALDSCRAGFSPAADPDCLESDLDEDGGVDLDDQARFLELAAEAGGLAADPPAPSAGCGLGPELVPALLALQAAFAAARRRISA